MNKRKGVLKLLFKATILIYFIGALVINSGINKKIYKEGQLEVTASTKLNLPSNASDKITIYANKEDGQGKASAFKKVSSFFNKDKIQPKLILKPVSIYSYEKVALADFVEMIQDETDCTITYLVEPKLDKIGEQQITIEARDVNNNVRVEKTTLTIKKDSTAPIIEGVLDKFIYLGDTISYKEGVTVKDDIDGEVELVIDNSNVDLRKVGVYQVIYTATDKSGNTSKAIMNLNVIEKPTGYVEIDEVNILADAVLDSITREDMTKYEKARAIFYWVKANVFYSKNSQKESWVTGAYEGFKYRKGDCFVYFATTKALLTRAGIQNVDVREVNGRHYWNMINCGEGWYHFDTTVFMDPVDVFMWTDEEVDNLYITGVKLHTWDKTMVPPSAI